MKPAAPAAYPPSCADPPPLATKVSRKMPEKKAITDSLIARMAGNIASGLMSEALIANLGAGYDHNYARQIAKGCVMFARFIAEELESAAPGTET